MTLDNLTVKLTSNENYKSLQANKQEQIKSLIKGYEDYASALSSTFYSKLAEIEAEQEKARKQSQTWGTILTVSTLGGYQVMKGLTNGMVDFVTGSIEMGTQLINNIGQVFVQDGRFGGGIDGFFKELGSDLLYTIADPIVSLGDGLTRGGYSIANAFGLMSDEDFNFALEQSGYNSAKMKDNVLSLWGSDGSKGMNDFMIPGSSTQFNNKEMMDDNIANHTFEFSRNFSRSVASGGNWFKDNVTPHIAGILTGGLGYAIEGSETNAFTDFIGGTMESVGRMIPAIASTMFLGEGSSIATAVSGGYFFASSFGSSFNDAIAKGVDIESAYTYAYSNAMIETLTEQIGGIKFGKMLPSDIIKSMLEEGMEEVYSELTSAGIESIINDGDVDNSDIFSRGAYAFFGGALSSGIMTGGGKFIGKKSFKGKTESLHKEVNKLYENGGKDYSKAQLKFNSLLDSTLKGYNKQNFLERNFLEGGKTQEEAIGNKAKFLEEAGFASLLIEYNQENQTFQLTKQGQDMKNDLKGYMGGRQNGVNIDVDNLAISKNRDGGIEHSERVEFATNEDVEGIKDINKKKIVNELLEKNRNIAFVKNLNSESGFIMNSNGFMYLDINMKTADMIAKVTSHEITHKAKTINPKGFNKLISIVEDKEVARALKDNGIVLLSNKELNAYRKDYMEQTGGNESLVNELIQEEKIANFVEKVITSEKTLEKIFNLSPELIETLDLATRDSLTSIDKKLNKFEKLFIKYGKEAMRFKRGSLIDAVMKNQQKTTYVKVGGKTYKMPKEITGFFNSENQFNLEASLEETHQFDDKPREYSEFSKKELIKFFELFDVNSNNEIDDIVDNMLEEYKNIPEYREIVGTKFAYIWSLLSENEMLQKDFVESVTKRIDETFKKGVEDGLISKEANESGISRVFDGATFRNIFAMNYIISNPKYASSVSLHTSDIYEKYSSYMGLFNEGKSGFIVSKRIIDVDIEYRKNMKEKFNVDNIFEDKELSSVFNNSNNKISEKQRDFMIKDLGAKNIIATNSKLESIYKEWGFLNQLDLAGNPILAYDYSPEMMSEWSNSYNNFLVFNGEKNGVEPLYINLERKKIKTERLNLEELEKRVKSGNPTPPNKTIGKFFDKFPNAVSSIDFESYSPKDVSSGFIYLQNGYFLKEGEDFYTTSISDISMDGFSKQFKNVVKLPLIESIDALVNSGAITKAVQVFDYIDVYEIFDNKMLNKIYDYIDYELYLRFNGFQDFLDKGGSFGRIDMEQARDNGVSFYDLYQSVDYNSYYGGISTDFEEVFGLQRGGLEDAIKDYESMLPHEDGSYNPRLEKLLYVNSNNIQNDNIYYKEIYDFYIKYMDIIDFIERKGFYLDVHLKDGNYFQDGLTKKTIELSSETGNYNVKRFSYLLPNSMYDSYDKYTNKDYYENRYEESGKRFYDSVEFFDSLLKGRINRDFIYDDNFYDFVLKNIDYIKNIEVAKEKFDSKGSIINGNSVQVNLDTKYELKDGSKVLTLNYENFKNGNYDFSPQLMEEYKNIPENNENTVEVIVEKEVEKTKEVEDIPYENKDMFDKIVDSFTKGIDANEFYKSLEEVDIYDGIIDDIEKVYGIEEGEFEKSLETKIEETNNDVEVKINEEVELEEIIEEEIVEEVIIEEEIVEEVVEPIKSKESLKRGNLDNGITYDKEAETLRKLLKDGFNGYNKVEYLKQVNDRLKKFNEIDLKELSKGKNGKKRVAIINELLKEYNHVIKRNYSRSELYNHLFNNVVQEVVIQISENFGESGFNSYDTLIDNIENIISQTMAHIDNTFVGNEVNMLNPNNPKGYQYTRRLNRSLRELENSKNKKELKEVLKSKRLNPIWDLINGLVELDIENNDSIAIAMAGIKNFLYKTRVEQVNSMSLDNDGRFAQTIPNVLKQNEIHIDNISSLMGHNQLVDINDASKGYKKANGLLGNYKMFDKFSGTRLDMFAFGNIFGMFMENSTGKTITNRIYEAQRKQLEVSNAFYDYFEKDGYLKKNGKNIDLLEKETTTLANLTDVKGNPITIPNSQVMYFRDVMLREIIRDRMIENGFRTGQQSNHFRDGGIVFINGNKKNRNDSKGSQIQGKITNVINLFNELDNAVNNHAFMKNYNNKVLGFFEIMYDFENIRNKDISGLELTNDKDTLATLNEEQRKILTKGLNEVDITNIYVPMRVEGKNNKGGSGSFNINNVIDMGIDDGMVMGITENKFPPLIDSINTIVPSYTRSVANFYGLYRIVNDLNILFNKPISMVDKNEITLTTKVNNLSPYIIKYYEKLLRDISGYSIQGDTTYESFNKAMGVVRRNFFKASLGLNIKVITTQFASMFTIATMYGDYNGNRANFTAKMMTNLFGKGSKTKAKYLIDNSIFYQDRARNSTYEISEATSSKFNKGKFNEVTEMFMEGINRTDSMINRAFFITLVESGMSEQEALRVTEEAIARYQSSGLAIGKNELLRTQHELLRVFTKFLGEPMKITSNLEESIKHLNLIKKFSTNQESINDMLDNQINEYIEENDALIVENINLEESIKKETKKSVIKKMQKEIDDNVETIEKNKEAIENKKIENEKFKKQIQDVIDGEEKVRQEFAKRVSALVVSVTWQAMLGIGFGLIRGGMKEKDKEEATWSFLLKQFGWQIASEMVGFVPFARDVYSLILDKYDAHVIGEFQSFNNLGSALNGLLSDITNGGDFNYGKHFRNISLYLGQIVGLPTRQIERYFTTPANLFMKSANYTYKDMTGQFVGNKDLNDAIRNGDSRLIETIIRRKMKSKGINLTMVVADEINALAKEGFVINPSGVPNSFTIDGIEYKNDKEKFAKVYDNASFVVEKLVNLASYKKLDSEHKSKLIKAVFNYYHQLAKQEVSGEEIFKKDRTYNLIQAFNYFKGQISYYSNMMKKQQKKERAN